MIYVIAYILIAFLFVYVLARFDDMKDSEEEVCALMSLLWPMTLAIYLFEWLWKLGRKHKKDK